MCRRDRLTAVKLPTMADYRKCGKSIALSSVIGTFIGALPALGATTAAMICYNESKRWSKYKHEFGKGAVEGWVAVVLRGRVIYELGGIPEDVAREAFRLAGHKLPLEARVITRAYMSRSSSFPAVQEPP